MAILYDWYENPGTNEEAPEERGLHPRPLLNGKVTMRQLYNRVHARSSLTVGDVMNAIDCLTQICGEELRNGHEVHIEGLGYFAPTLEATQKVTRSTPNKHLKLRLKSISFRPDVRLKQAMTGVSAIRAHHRERPPETVAARGQAEECGEAHATHLPGHAGVLRCVARCKGGAVRTESGFTGKADEQEDGRKR